MKLTAFAAKLGEVTRRWISEAVSPLDARLKAIETELKQLKAAPTLQYRGTWEAREYMPGEFVTSGGSIWHCRHVSTASDKPGASTAWQLAVKRGADGKDAR